MPPSTRCPGVFNVAADGVLALSEMIGLLGKRPLPVLPPWGTGLLTAPLRALGVQIPPEMLNLMRFGRGLDNRRYKASGFEYGYTTREAVALLLRAPAPAADPPRGRVVLHLRGRGRAVPAPQPARAAAEAAAAGGVRDRAGAVRHLSGAHGDRRLSATGVAPSGNLRPRPMTCLHFRKRSAALATRRSPITLPMGRKAQISLVAVVFTAIIAALLVYLWDSSREDTIAEGVTIGGVDVGGLDADAARSQVETNLLDPINETVTVKYGGRGVHADAARERSHAPTSTGPSTRRSPPRRRAGFPARTWRAHHRRRGRRGDHPADLLRRGRGRPLRHPHRRQRRSGAGRRERRAERAASSSRSPPSRA